LWPVVAKWYAAATSAPRPAMQTGRMRAASLRGVAAVEVTPAPLPGELLDRVPRQLTEPGRNQHDHREEDDQTRLPPQPPQPPERDARPRDFALWGVPRYPPLGGFAWNVPYDPESPASASGRLAHAKRVA